MRKKADIKAGYIKVSDDLEEAISRSDLHQIDFRILSWFKCHTYGRRIKSSGEWIPLDAIKIVHNTIALDIGSRRDKVGLAIKRLLGLKILRAKSDGKVGINSRLEAWACGRIGRDFKPAAENANVPESGTKCTQNGYIDVPKSGTKCTQFGYIARTRAEIRERKDKGEERTLPSFSLFWDTYPVRKGRAEAERVFAEINPDGALLARILAAVAVQKAALDFNPRFAKSPANWLRDRRWEDEIIEEPKSDIVV